MAELIEYRGTQTRPGTIVARRPGMPARKIRVCCLGSSRARNPAFEVFNPLTLESTRRKTRRGDRRTGQQRGATGEGV